MDAFIEALRQLVEKPEEFQGKGPARPRAITADLTDAPASVRHLADAMANHHYYIELGDYSMFCNTDDAAVQSLAEKLRTAAERGHLDLAKLLPGFVPERTLELAADGGRRNYLGLSWRDGPARVIVVRLDEPTETNLVRGFTTPDEILTYLVDRLDGEPPSADLVALRELVGTA